MDLESMIAEMREQGATDEQILTSLEQMAQEGKIAPDDLERAKQLLGDNPSPEADEKEEASRLFGLNLM